MDDWIDVLRTECARSSQSKVADRLKLSATTVNQILKGTYNAKSTAGVEARVRGEFMNKTVACPVLGEISTRYCQDAQRRPFAATNPQRIRLFKACHQECPHGGKRA